MSLKKFKHDDTFDFEKQDLKFIDIKKFCKYGTNYRMYYVTNPESTFSTELICSKTKILNSRSSYLNSYNHNEIKTLSQVNYFLFYSAETRSMIDFETRNWGNWSRLIHMVCDFNDLYFTFQKDFYLFLDLQLQNGQTQNKLNILDRIYEIFSSKTIIQLMNYKQNDYKFSVLFLKDSIDETDWRINLIPTIGKVNILLAFLLKNRKSQDLENLSLFLNKQLDWNLFEDFIISICLCDYKD